MVLGDNTFAWGMIAETQFESVEDEKSVRALREFNLSIAQGGRFRPLDYLRAKASRLG